MDFAASEVARLLISELREFVRLVTVLDRFVTVELTVVIELVLSVTSCARPAVLIAMLDVLVVMFVSSVFNLPLRTVSTSAIE